MIFLIYLIAMIFFAEIYLILLITVIIRIRSAKVDFFYRYHTTFLLLR